MSRFALRNKEKIEDHYNKKILNRINKSLKEYFKSDVNQDDIKIIDGEDYNLLTIDDIEHTSGIVIFHIITITHDVYKLAFKEFVN